MLFRKLVEKILTEYDRDDPNDRYWEWSKKDLSTPIKNNINKRDDNIFELTDIDNLQIQPVQKVKPNDLVYIKTIEYRNNEPVNTTYLSNNALGRTYDKAKAKKFTLKAAEEYVKNNPRKFYKQTNSEIHNQIESI